MKTFKLEVITPERTVFEGSVTSLTVQAEDGSLGVLANHAPLLTALNMGEATITQEDGRVLHMLVSGGFLEVAQNQAQILADAGEEVADIDTNRAQAALERARKRLQEHAEQAYDQARAEAALRRALMRLKLSGQGPPAA